MEKLVFSPVFETLINRAVFINQDIIVCPKGTCCPDNIVEVIKFLFGEGATLEHDVVNDSAHLVIKGASYILSGARTLNADWVYKEVKEK